MKASASAPGKVVLSGEYAVLDGAPAVCMAVDRYARVTVRTGNDTHTVVAPGFSLTTGRFEVSDGHFAWLEGAKDFAIVEAVWRELDMLEAEPLALSLDTREFVDVATATKLGIGSSAALTVSLAAALRAALDSDASLDDIAMAAHRNLQQGVGSGVDIACSLRGGIITYRMHGSIGRIPGWPDDLVFALLWSGVSASTTDRLLKLEDQPTKRSRAALADAASRTAASWADGESAAITAEMKAYTVALQEFSIDHGLGIFDAGHGDLAAMAPDDVVYKPCGAGGGDLGIALGRDEEAVAEFVGIAAAYGFQPIDLAISPVGIQTAREED